MELNNMRILPYFSEEDIRMLLKEDNHSYDDNDVHQIMDHLEYNFDANIGINWEIIRNAININMNRDK